MNEKRKKEKEKSYLNKIKSDDSLKINRGVELLLRNRRNKPPKVFQLKFGKIVSIFRRELHFSLDIQFDIRKKEG
tara:strand:+ start:1767 stop:1991 length:225 start_codon:yes stop_codon:yes gene_type:complete